MSQYRNYGPRRSDMRKKQRNNIWLNGAIAVVVMAIMFIAGTLIFGGGDSETATVEEPDQEENEEINEETEETEETEESDEDIVEVVKPTESDQETEENNDTDTNDEENNDSEDTETSMNELPETNGDWKPVGTVQEEPFEAVFKESHTNWEEMREALLYATGLSDDELIIWFLGNGGDLQSAVGTVSNYDNRSKPYEVRLEWVTNEGWMPVSVIQLDSNPYRD